MTVDRMAGSIHVVVPLKGGAAAKSRLAAMLSPAARVELAAAMAQHVLAVTLDWDRARSVTVVTGCMHTAAAAARQGARVMIDRAREGASTGTNHGTAAACLQALSTIPSGTRVLFINGDLPLLSRTALDRMAALPHAVVIAPDERALGTNALLMTAGSGILPAFGAHSLRAHLDACTDTGIAASVFADRATGCDIDTPEDLASLGVWRGRRWAACRVAA